MESGGSPKKKPIFNFNAIIGIIAVCSGLVYADLGSSFPSAGGDAHYYEVAFGKSVAYVYVWTLFFVINGGDTALLALTFARNGVIFLTEEMKNPKKDVSQAIFGGIAIVSFIYLCLNAAYLSVLTTTEIKASAVIGMDTTTVAMGGHVGQIIAILVATSTLGTLNSAVLYHGRYLYAAARSGYIFSWMRYIGKESGAPSVALLAHGLWCIFLLIVLKSFHQILYYFGPVGLFFCGLTAAAHIKIRRESPDLLRADTVAFYPYIPIIVMLVCLYLIVMSFITNLLPTCLAFGLAFLSLPCYGLSQRCRWKRSNLKASFMT